MAFSAMAAVAMLVALVVVLRPWAETLTPQQKLAQAYQNTITRTFTGTIEVRGPEGLLLRGTFEHAPGDRWRIRYQETAGTAVEEVQIGEQVWQKRGDAGWESVQAGPMLSLPADGGGLGRVPALIAGVGRLLSQGRFERDRYVAKASEFVAPQVRLVETDNGGPVGAVPHSQAKNVEVRLSAKEVINRVALNIMYPVDDGSVIVDVALERLDTAEDIRPPAP